MGRHNGAASSTALGDLRVLDLAGAMGAYCTKQLAELGADVIKVEPPSGDPMRRIGPFYHDDPDTEHSLFFFHFNTNKRSITLDLTTTQGVELFRRLVTDADVVVETMPPGHLAELGLSYESLRSVNPRLTVASITAFGQNGRHRDYQADDLIGTAMGGLMSLAGFPGEAPQSAGGFQGYHLASADALMGILAAVCWRDASGEGQWVDVSMQEAVISATELMLPAYTARKIIRKRTGRQVYRGWNELFRCKDGWVMCSPFGGGGWRKMLDWAASEGLAGRLAEPYYAELLDVMGSVQMDRQADPGRQGKRSLAERGAEIAYVEQVWEGFLAAHTREELFTRSQAMGVRLMPVYDASDVLNDPQMLAREWFQEVNHPELGEVLTYAGPPYRLSLTPSRIVRRAPSLGEHNREIFCSELGLSLAELSCLKQSGVI